MKKSKNHDIIVKKCEEKIGELLKNGNFNMWFPFLLDAMSSIPKSEVDEIEHDIKLCSLYFKKLMKENNIPEN